MDYQPYEQSHPSSDYPSQPPRNGIRSSLMARAALICGILSIVSCMVFYISIPLGAIAILLGLLSKGGANSVSSKAFGGMVCGISGIILTVFLYLISFTILMRSYGGFTRFYEQLETLEDADMDEIYDDIQSHIDSMFDNSPVTSR